MTADEAIAIRVRLDTAVTALSAALDAAYETGADDAPKANKGTPEYKLMVALIAALQARDAVMEKTL